jgi:hypothetical protein
MCFYSSDPTAKILIVGDEDRIPYMRPPLSKVGLLCSFRPPGSGYGKPQFLIRIRIRALVIYQILEKISGNFFSQNKPVLPARI